MLLIPGYVDILDTEDGILIKSNLHGTIVKLSKKEYIDEFNLIKNGDIKDSNSELVTFLKDQELLATKEEIYNNIDIVYSSLEKHLKVTILPTEKCNFACAYCYEDFKNGRMTNTIVEGIKKFIEEKVSSMKFTHVYINWFGGEPTLCKDIVLDISNHIIELGKKFEFKFQSNMTTNGYLLTSNDLLDYYNVNITDYQITIDGFNHDKNRPLINGQGTLKTIIKNLNEIKKLPEDLKFKIVVRYNILEENEDLHWYNELKNIFQDDTRFSVLIRTVSNFGGDKVSNLNILDKNNYKAVLKKHINYAKSLGITVENELSKNPFSLICYASLKNGYIFRSNGKIVKCTLELDDSKNNIGYLDSQNNVVIDKKINNNWCKSEIHDKCLTCDHLLSCLNKCCPKNNLNEEDCYKWRT